MYSPAFFVNAPSITYPVFVESGVLDNIGECLLDQRIKGPVYLITEPKLSVIYGGMVERSIRSSGIQIYSYCVQEGETSKNLVVAGELYSWLAEHHCERDSTIIALGGGMIGDLVGFVAGTFLRGVQVIQIPTSLAAMVDASIGGKTAINLSSGKNLVGVFRQPAMVIADMATLSTLPPRELASGWAEAIKHGLILDEELFNIFEENSDVLLKLQPGITAEVISRSMAIKAGVIEKDEMETNGLRTILNYGHTIGHGLETATGYVRFLHGEAVSIGMVSAGIIAQEMGLISSESVSRYTNLLERFGLPINSPGVDPELVLGAMKFDKKSESGRISWILLEEVGSAIVRSDVPQDLIDRTVSWICN